MTQPTHDKIQAALNQLEFGSRRELSVDVETLTQNDAALLADAIRTHAPELQSIKLSCGEAEPNSIATLLAPLSGSAALTECSLFGFDLSDDARHAVADFLKSGVTLEILGLKKIGLDDAAMQEIGLALCHQPGIIALSLTENPCSAAAMESLLPALDEMPKLTSFYFNAENLGAEIRETVGEHLTPETHPNLVNCSMALAGNVSQQNERHLLKQLQDIQSSNLDSLSLGELQAIERRMPGLYEVARNAGDLGDALGEYETHLLSLPTPPKDRPATLDDLLQPDARGLCALDNPQLWKTHPTLLQGLAERGQLSAASLEDLSPRGIRVIDYIAAFAPPEEAVATLANAGSPIRNDWLVRDDGSATETLQLFKQQHRGIRAIFQNENWNGAPARDIKATLGALTDATRASIPNRHSLLANASRQASRQVER